MNRNIVSCLCLVLLISVAKANYSDCGSSLSNVTAIVVTDCTSSDSQCVLHRNTNVTIQIQFIPKNDIQNVSAVVHGIILGVPIPFDLPNPDGCRDSGLACPLKGGQTYAYQTSFPILKKYPRVSVDVKFELEDPNSSDITCSLIPSKIQ
ncbi:hypothetical protein Trydic_g10048 [Trypoxylus dichotomus]